MTYNLWLEPGQGKERKLSSVSYEKAIPKCHFSAETESCTKLLNKLS